MTEPKTISHLEFYCRLVNARYADTHHIGDGKREEKLLECYVIGNEYVRYLEEIDRGSPNYGVVVSEIFYMQGSIALQ